MLSKEKNTNNQWNHYTLFKILFGITLLIVLIVMTLEDHLTARDSISIIVIASFVIGTLVLVQLAKFRSDDTD
ncbi:MAG: hypothetical protein WBC91_10375 [Phototrophicaceae bacterium]